MSFYDEQPDGDQHGECAAEIQRLQKALDDCHEALARAITYIEPRVARTGGFGETVLLPQIKLIFEATKALP